jgi:hypothetical protein
MSVIEGGPRECTRDGHHFKTSNIDEWNEHMDDGNHIDIIETLCHDCKTNIEVTLPYVRIDADGGKAANVPTVRCPDCEEEYQAKAKTIKISKVTGGEGT